jgi:hypothetical protein
MATIRGPYGGYVNFRSTALKPGFTGEKTEPKVNHKEYLSFFRHIEP